MLFIIINTLMVALTTARVLYRPDLYRSTRLAWIMVLFFLPLLGVVLYMFFGEARVGRSIQERYKEQTRSTREYYTSLNEEEKYPGEVPGEYQAITDYAHTLNSYPALSGNKVELMADSAAFRARLIEDIDAAKTSISILYYIWLDDQTGTQVADALVRASARGVKVRVMVDSLGSRALFKSDIWDKITATRIENIGALPLGRMLLTSLTRRLDVRNHRKITVIDGHITYCGSQNCSDPEFRIKPKYAPWIDIMARVEGPVVNQNQLLFAVDWMVERNLVIKDFELKGTRQKANCTAQIWGAGPTIGHSSTQQLLVTIVTSAQRELRLTTPYFVPDEPLLDALCAAARRGVKVSLIVPQKNDSKIVRFASQSYYPALLEAGVKIYEFQGGLLHAKIITLDGKVTQIGSTNLDMRSFDLNYENNIIIYDEAFTRAVNLRQDTYMKTAVAVLRTDVEKWSPVKIIWNNLFATVGPIL